MTAADQRPDGYVADVRLLLVHQVDRQQWGTVGGAVEPGESPTEAAVREAREETGLEVELTGPVAALGGPGFEMTYPNGDECAYISIVFDAQVVGGELVADGVEVSQCAWFTSDALATADIGTVSRSVLLAVGAIQPTASKSRE